MLNTPGRVPKLKHNVKAKVRFAYLESLCLGRALSNDLSLVGLLESGTADFMNGPFYVKVLVDIDKNSGMFDLEAALVEGPASLPACLW